MKKRKICVVTGSRADYGLLFWLLKEIQADPALELQVIATGMHLSHEFGLTYKIIEEDGFFLNAKVEMLMSSDSPVGITQSIGIGTIGFASALDGLQPDILVLLGDRYEILAAAQAALIASVPIAHIHGGETTEGVIDEAIRHAITKMSQFHFVAAEDYRRRVIQLGEMPERVLNYGAPGLDNIKRLKLLNREELEQSINFKFGQINFLVTYHPETLEKSGPQKALTEIFKALDHFPEAKVIITKHNADTYGRIIGRMIDVYASKHPGRVTVYTSLGQLNYLSAMKIMDLVIGNSSSGIIEAPALKRPSINIGNRQTGRLKAASIIDCTENSQSIISAIKKALSHEFQIMLPGVSSLYGCGHTSAQIKEFLKTVDIDTVLMKKFYDICF
ncbi:MAG: UDP-N-acetylglucosamine 2-epimerase (hydrolyzing) [Firmicutes bacterium HGW-Firmicutes-14]|nr:MAG: UDP-N-acetylglucosamine 2-epimerase (hydrolyzing) [Firmicutes bacterium HGW-Firmicutes-14]